MSTSDEQDLGSLRLDDAWPLEPAVLFGVTSVPVQFESVSTDPATGDPLPPAVVRREVARLALGLPRDVLEAAAPAVLQNHEVYLGPGARTGRPVP